MICPTRVTCSGLERGEIAKTIDDLHIRPHEATRSTAATAATAAAAVTAATASTGSR